MGLLTRKSKADKHKAAGDRYVAGGGSSATRDACDRTAAQLAQSQQRAEMARAELARGNR